MGAFDGARQFLAETTLTSFIDERTVCLSTVSDNSTIADAMKLLATKHIMSVPVVDEDGEYFGCVSVADVLKGLTRDLVDALGPHYVENIANVTPAQVKEVGEDLTGKAVRSVLHEGDLWLKGDPATTVLDVVLQGFNVQENRVHHRIYVCDPAKARSLSTKDRTTVVNIQPGTEKEEASGWRPTDVISQLDVVIKLYEHKEVLEATLDKSLEDVEAFLGAEQCVPGSMTALEAFHDMAVDHKSCLGVTSSEGKLVGNLSISDLRYLPTDGFELLLRPVAEYVALVHGKGPSLEEALKGTRVPGAEEGDWEKVMEGTPLVKLSPQSTLEQLLAAITKTRAHRVHVVAEDGTPVSIITLTDILRLVTKVKAPAPVQKPVVPQESEEEEEDEEEQ